MSVFFNADKPTQKTFTPLGKMVAVNLVADASGNTTEHGLIMPDKTAWKTVVCRVVAVGPSCEFVKEGNIILVSPEVQMRIVRYAGDEVLLLHEEQAYGIVDQ